MTKDENSEEVIIDGEVMNETNQVDVAGEVVNFSEASIGTVKAELVRMSQSSAEKIVATEVEIKQG